MISKANRFKDSSRCFTKRLQEILEKFFLGIIQTFSEWFFKDFYTNSFKVLYAHLFQRFLQKFLPKFSFENSFRFPLRISPKYFQFWWVFLSGFFLTFFLKLKYCSKIHTKILSVITREISLINCRFRFNWFILKLFKIFLQTFSQR